MAPDERTRDGRRGRERSGLGRSRRGRPGPDPGRSDDGPVRARRPCGALGRECRPGGRAGRLRGDRRRAGRAGGPARGAPGRHVGAGARRPGRGRGPRRRGRCRCSFMPRIPVTASALLGPSGRGCPMAEPAGDRRPGPSDGRPGAARADRRAAVLLARRADRPAAARGRLRAVARRRRRRGGRDRGRRRPRPGGGGADGPAGLGRAAGSTSTSPAAGSAVELDPPALLPGLGGRLGVDSGAYARPEAG